MSATEVMDEIDRLTVEDQKQILSFLVSKIITHEEPGNTKWLGRKLSFEEACEVVFRENRELLQLLAK